MSSPTDRAFYEYERDAYYGGNFSELQLRAEKLKFTLTYLKVTDYLAMKISGKHLVSKNDRLSEMQFNSVTKDQNAY